MNDSDNELRLLKRKILREEQTTLVHITSGTNVRSAGLYRHLASEARRNRLVDHMQKYPVNTAPHVLAELTLCGETGFFLRIPSLLGSIL